MKPVMYLIANKGAGMSAPKLAAQVAHAAVEAYRTQYDESLREVARDNETTQGDLLDAWYLGGHYTKIVLEARDEVALRNIRDYLDDRGFESILIIDEGRTEIPAHTATAIGCWVVDKDDPHTAATFGDFKLFKEDKPKQVEDGKPKQEIQIPSVFTSPPVTNPWKYANFQQGLLPDYTAADDKFVNEWYRCNYGVNKQPEIKTSNKMAGLEGQAWG